MPATSKHSSLFLEALVMKYFYIFVTLQAFVIFKSFFHFPNEWYPLTHKYITRLLVLVSYKHSSLFLDGSVMKIFAPLSLQGFVILKSFSLFQLMVSPHSQIFH
jgi:hypothetical protein